MTAKTIGQPVRRKEDQRLLTGKGQFSDDFNLPGQAYALMVRSPHPHADIVAIDTAAAEAMPGVLAVLTGADCVADGVKPIPHSAVPSNKVDLPLTAPGGSGDVFIGPHLFLPVDKVRHVGEAVAMVIAETRSEAQDAAERVAVDYRPLPAVSGTVEATRPDAPVLWEEVPGNVCIDSTFGDPAAVDAAFERAARVVTETYDIVRVTGVPMEPRAALGAFEPETGKYTLWSGGGGAVRHKRELMGAFGVGSDKIRVVNADVGGNFGTRNRLYVEFGLVMWAARRLGRPVKYLSDRSEAFISDYQGRDLVTTVSLALDAEGRFLAMRADNISNVGARAVSFSPLGKGTPIITGPYAVPVAAIRARAVFSNTPPTNAYRSSGRPEVVFALERLIDTAARRTGIDRIELRRRNLLPAHDRPVINPFGMEYDSGDYARSMEMAMALADWDGFPARRAEAQSRGRLLGLGFANYLESSGGAPMERCELTVHAEGRIGLVIGTQPSGQGHETSFSQVASDWLGVETDVIDVIVGDTDIVKIGGGSHSGRSMRMAGTAITMAADALIERGQQIAAHVLEAAEADIAFADGRFTIAGTDRSLDWFELAAACETATLPADLAGGLEAAIDNEMNFSVYPNGCHICEVEVDPETGRFEMTRYTAIDDVGRCINPLIVHGQTHGGIVQGLGQAFAEHIVTDPTTGQPLTGSLMDYGLIRADEVPSFTTALNEVPSPTNPLGVKAGGEGGTTPAPAVAISAIVDALSPYGIEHVPLPATPMTIWNLIREAEAHG